MSSHQSVSSSNLLLAEFIEGELEVAKCMIHWEVLSRLCTNQQLLHSTNNNDKTPIIFINQSTNQSVKQPLNKIQMMHHKTK